MRSPLSTAFLVTVSMVGSGILIAVIGMSARSLSLVETEPQTSTPHGKTVAFEVAGQNIRIPQRLGGDLTLPAEPLFSIAFALDAETLWNAFDDKHLKIPLEAWMAKVTEDLFGPDASMTYDVLPLLKGPWAFHMAEGPQGTVFLLESSRAERERDSRLEMLHAGSRETLSSFRVVERSLANGRWEISSLREDSETSLDTTESINGWQVRTTGFTSAVRGGDLLLSNSASAVESRVRAFAPATSFPRVTSRKPYTLIAAGFIDRSRAMPFPLEELIHGLLPVFATDEKKALWSLEANGSSRSLTIAPFSP